MDSRRRYLGSLGVVLVIAQLAVFAKCSVSAKDCLLAAEGRAPPFRGDNGSLRLPSGTQAIITSYKFGCCGHISAWQTYVQPGGGSHRDGAYDINFQVWRPSPTEQETGCYSMVGENRFTSITLDVDGLVSESPEPSNILTVQPGDVVGYYTLNNGPASNDGEGIQLDTSTNNNNVWYHTGAVNDNGIPNCSFPVGIGTNRILMSSTNAAPVLSVDVSSFSCPPTPPTPPSPSSSLPPSTSTNSAYLANSATTVSPITNVITPTTPISVGSAALSTAIIASIAAVGGLLTLLCTLLLAITIVKVQHKRQRALTETSSIVADQPVNTLMEMKGNEAYTTTSHSTNECCASAINTESNLAYETVNTRCEDQNYEYAEPHYY